MSFFSHILSAVFNLAISEHLSSLSLSLRAQYSGFNCIYRTKCKVPFCMHGFSKDVDFFQTVRGAFRVSKFYRAFRRFSSVSMQVKKIHFYNFSELKNI